MTTPDRKLLFLVPGIRHGETREDFARRAVEAARNAGAFDRRRKTDEPRESGELVPRIDEANPDHHLWNNNGTWWFHCTVHHPDHTTERIRFSLNTKDVRIARRRRDHIFNRGKEGQS